MLNSRAEELRPHAPLTARPTTTKTTDRPTTTNNHLSLQQPEENPSPRLTFLRNSFELATRVPEERLIRLEPPNVRSSVDSMKREVMRAEGRRHKAQRELLESQRFSGIPAGWAAESLVPGGLQALQQASPLPRPGSRASTARPSTTSTVSSADTSWYTMFHGKENALSPVGQHKDWTFRGQGLRKPISFFPKPGDWALEFRRVS